MNNINEQLKRLKTEDFIWYVYFFIVAFALLSNYYERNYLISKNKNSYNKFKTINITIFFIAFIIYLYFVVITYDNLKSYQNKLKDKAFYLSEVKFIGALLFLIGGVIYLITEFFSVNIDAEVGIEI